MVACQPLLAGGAITRVARGRPAGSVPATWKTPTIVSRTASPPWCVSVRAPTPGGAPGFSNRWACRWGRPQAAVGGDDEILTTAAPVSALSGVRLPLPACPSSAVRSAARPIMYCGRRAGARSVSMGTAPKPWPLPPTQERIGLSRPPLLSSHLWPFQRSCGDRGQSTSRRSRHASGCATSPRQMIVSPGRTRWRHSASRWRFIAATSVKPRSNASSDAVAQVRSIPARVGHRATVQRAACPRRVHPRARGADP